MTALSTLAELTGGRLSGPWQGVEVTSAAIGSQDVLSGGLFCAVPGTRVHGATYAAGSQAAAVLTDAEGAEILQGGSDPVDLPLLIVDDVRAWMGPVAAEIYDNPSRKLKIVGITGTSGKTTTSYLVEKALMGVGRSVGIIGTTGTRINGEKVPTSLTTPEAPTMQALLARMVDAGVSHVVMEVSSHALQLGRVRGIEYDVTAFTNLSQDHLDFHPTMEDYFQAKATLFTQGSAAAVICCGDDWGRRMLDIAQESDASAVFALYPSVGEGARGAASAGEGAQPTHTCAISSSSVTPSGRQEIHVSADESGDFEYSIGMAGVFNQANSLVALGCVQALGEDVIRASRAIADVQVPGRMQLVDAGQDFLAMVDYAHKPGAVEAVLESLSSYLPSPTGRIGIVLGAGGNRDTDKRPKMGAIAARLADAVFITDDNPRDEDPAAIRAEVLAGARQGTESTARTVEEIADRAEAIAAAVAWAHPGDAVVVAGKGHEKGQLVRGVLHDFDDVDFLTRALRSQAGTQER